jgi:hypothetical protein
VVISRLLRTVIEQVAGSRSPRVMWSELERRMG